MPEIRAQHVAGRCEQGRVDSSPEKTRTPSDLKSDRPSPFAVAGIFIVKEDWHSITHNSGDRALRETKTRDKMYYISKRTPLSKADKRWNRSMTGGSWKHDNPKVITDGTNPIGRWKTLAFEEVVPGLERKTSWRMHEYENIDIEDPFVLCVIFETKRSSGTTSRTSNLSNTGMPGAINQVGKSSNSQIHITRSSTLPNPTNSLPVNMNPFQAQSSDDHSNDLSRFDGGSRNSNPTNRTFEGPLQFLPYDHPSEMISLWRSPQCDYPSKMRCKDLISPEEIHKPDSQNPPHQELNFPKSNQLTGGEHESVSDTIFFESNPQPDHPLTRYWLRMLKDSLN